MHKVHVAVVGLGKMGRHHVRVLRDLPAMFDVVGGFDVDGGRRDAVCAEFGVKPLGDIEDALALAEVVYVATPTISHADVALRAISAGRHVFIEKPIANTVDGANKLVRLAAERGVRIGVGHTERFNPVIVWLKKRLIGEHVLSINIERIGPRPPRIKDVGIITDLSVHDFDLLVHLTGAPIVKTRCLSRASKGHLEDVAQIIAETKNGTIGAINTNWFTPFKSRRIQVATEGFFIQADLLRFSAQVYTLPDCSDLNTYNVQEAAVPWQEPLMAQATAFYAYLFGENSGTATGEEGLEVLRWVNVCAQGRCEHDSDGKTHSD